MVERQIEAGLGLVLREGKPAPEEDEGTEVELEPSVGEVLEVPDMDLESGLGDPELVASTGDTYSCTIAESRFREDLLLQKMGKDSKESSSGGRGVEDEEMNYFKSMEWCV
jgi:hypothetical protein